MTPGTVVSRVIEASRAWWTAHRRPVLAAGAGLAAAMSVLWFRVVPDAVDDATFVVALVTR